MYQPLFNIEIIHAYSPNILEYVEVRPTEESIALMHRYGLILRRSGNAFLVLKPLQSNSFQQNEKLVFNIFPCSSDFITFTDFPTLETGDVVLFTNQGLANGEDLIISSVSSSEKYNGFTSAGQVEIELSELNEEASFKANYSSKSIQWRYYFITKDDGATHTVKHKNLLFNKIEQTSDDVILNKLNANYEPKGMHVRAFASDQPIAFQDFPRKDIQLKKDTTTIISHLPNPEVNDNGIKIIRIN